MVKTALTFIIIVHSLIHLLGFIKAFNLAQVNQLTGEISKGTGLFWLLATVLFLVMITLYLLNSDLWWMVGAVAVILSQILIILSWSDAKYGTIANIILIVPIIAAFAGQLPNSYQNRFEVEVKEGLNRYPRQELLKEEDMVHLPQPVQKYIRYSGAIGKEKLHNFRAVFQGQFKTKPDSEFLDIRAVQYNFFDDPARIFYMDSNMFGLPVEGLHMYIDATASMQIKLAYLLQVVNARGPEMNQGETVTMFNDICFLAPAALVDKNIEWEPIDSTTVRAAFTNQGNTISALLFFNEKGELVNFFSEDRFESADGNDFKNYRWSTPLTDYKNFGGRKLASHGEAIWHKPEGEYTYAKFNLVDIKYNVTEYIGMDAVPSPSELTKTSN